MQGHGPPLKTASLRRLIDALPRRRYPFLPPLLCAIAGISFSACVPLPSSLLLGLALASFALFLAAPPLSLPKAPALARGGFLLFLIASFALLYQWQTRDAPAARLSLPPGGLLVEATGIVAAEPRVFEDDSSSFDLRLSSLHANGADIPCRSVTILVNWRGPAPAYGNEVAVRGVLQPIPPPRNPGQFDFAAWKARQGILSLLVVNHPHDARILNARSGNPLLSLALRSRAWMGRTLSEGIDDPVVSRLILGMVLGDTSSLPGDVKEDFRGTGTFHLFSVSGLHVGILALILWQIMKPLRVPRRAAAALIIPILFFYVLLTGWQPASVRSAIMASIVLAGFVINRAPVVFNGVCAAAFLILLARATQLFNPGFQLSFTVVSAIILLARPLTALLERPILPDPFFPKILLSLPQRLSLHFAQWLAGLAAVSLGAWLGSLPLTLYYFHLVSLSALPANLVAVPVSFAIMAVGTLSLGCGLLSLSLSAIVNQVNWLLASLLLSAINFLASLPGAYFYLPAPQIPRPLAEIVVFDFGSGGALSLRSQGRHWLLDPGPARFHDSVIVPFLRTQGRRSLDGILLTHGDSSHIGAAEPLLSTCPPRLVLDSPLDDRSPVRARFHAALARLGKPKTIIRSGDSFPLSPSATLHILFPPRGTTATTADDKAIVARLDIGSTRILLLSDSGLLTEQWLLAHVPDQLPCDIVIKGSHRSGSSDFLDLLRLARPRVLVSSAAPFPATELPSSAWAASLDRLGITLFRQDAAGAVAIRVFPGYSLISGTLNHQSCRLSR